MTTQEAAIELHVSAGTVNRLINDGKLPAIIIGRKRFIKRKDVAALIKRTR
jgi:excisionase family DNA binding protein